MQPSENEDDSLGYYPDGVKRTLTDEQIAIFRHSEIQELIRQHQARLDDSENDDTNSVVIDEVAPVSKKEPPVAAPTIKLRVETGQYNRDRPRSNKKRKRGKKANQEPRANPDDFMDEDDGRTFRRVCREMDEQKSADVELDY